MHAMIISDIPWSALVIDDDPGIRQSLRLCLEAAGGHVHHVGTVAGGLDLLDRSHVDVVFLDLWLGNDSGLAMLPEILRRQSNAGVIVVTAFASYESAVEAMRLGAADYLPKPFTPAQVRSAAARVLQAALMRRRLTELSEQIKESEAEIRFETCSQAYASFLQTARRAAASDAAILLRGQSGTGKTMLARWIRAHSNRPQGPFMTVHCPLLAGELMSSSLFGHRKGAFTGAVADAVGKVEQAEGGTLFLDEVADLPGDAQSRLLRFLNDKTYERVGEAKERVADVRLIAATNRPLEQEVAAGRFREDLWFRLNVISLWVPALRDRVEDVVPMAEHYLAVFCRRQQRHALRFSEAALAAIVAHRWPGNLRELSNAVERAVILCPAAVIEPADLGLPKAVRTAQSSIAGTNAVAEPVALGAPVPLEAVEREHIARVVAASPSFDTAAKTLGIDITTLQRKRKRYGLA